MHVLAEADEDIGDARVAAILLLMLGGAVIRSYGLGDASLSLDEGFSAWVISLRFADLLRVVRHDVSPPLYYLLLKGWAGLFGDSESGLRSLSVVASVVCIPLAAVTVRRITSSRLGALSAAALLALSFRQIGFAQQARCYTLLALAMLVCLYSFVRREQGGWQWLISAAIAAAAGLWMHNIAILYFAGLNPVYLVMPSRRTLFRRAVELAALDAAVLALYSPWLPSLLFQLDYVKGLFWAPAPAASILVGTLVHSSGIAMGELAAIIGSSAAVAAVALGITGMLLVAGISDGAKRRWTLALALLAFVPIAISFAQAHLGSGVFVRKSFMPSEVPLALAFGIAASAGKRRWISLTLIGAMLAGQIICIVGGDRRASEGWRSVVSFINGHSDQTTLTVYLSNDAECMYPYYTRRLGQTPQAVTGVPASFFAGNPPRTMRRVTSDADLADLRETISRTKPSRVLLVLSAEPFHDPEGRTRKYLGEQMRLVESHEFPVCTVLEYAAR
jgi:4-amino-4-deoxy-L-arabinose transferase-like glycosyltransferase